MISPMMNFGPMPGMPQIQNILGPMMNQPYMAMGGPASISLPKYVLYVGNLGPAMTDEELKRIFSAYGNPIGTTIKRDHETQASKGFAFVTFTSQAEADAARLALNHQIIQGRELGVCFKKSPTEYGAV